MDDLLSAAPNEPLSVVGHIAGGIHSRLGPHPFQALAATHHMNLACAEAGRRMRRALPADARHEGSFWYFSLPESGIEPLLRALIEGEAGILSLSIERAGLHDAFVAIAGEAAARALEEEKEEARR